MSPSFVINTIINHIKNTLRIICRADRPLDVQGIRRTEQQQQPAASPGSRPAQVSPVRRRRVHQYGEAILPRAATVIAHASHSPCSSAPDATILASHSPCATQPPNGEDVHIQAAKNPEGPPTRVDEALLKSPRPF